MVTKGTKRSVWLCGSKGRVLCMASLLVPASITFAAAQDIESDLARKTRTLEAGALRFSAEALRSYDGGRSTSSWGETGSDADATLAALPLIFVQNEGQWATSAGLVARRGNMLMRLERDAVVLPSMNRTAGRMAS